MRKHYNITPEGTRDLLFEECGAQKKVENILSDVFKNRGFTEVITPSIEFLDVFNLKSHNFPNEQMYKLVDTKGRIIVMRPDSTMPIARLVATRLKGHPLPIRLFYNQPVFTLNQSLNGRSDEVVQSGIEIIGSSSKRADLEVIATAVEALNSCNTTDFRLEIGHIGIFNTLVEALGVDYDVVEEIRWLIEVKNYPALNDLLDSIEDSDCTGMLKQLPRLFGGEEVFETASKMFNNSKITEILEYLKTIYHALSELGLHEKITVDLGIVNRADYYTGMVFRGYIEGFGENVLSGGRYDHLISEFGCDLAATGFGINVDAIARALLKQKVDFGNKIPDVLVHAENGYEMKALLYCKDLIKQGKTAENSVFEDLSQAEAYAKQKGIKQIDIISEDVTLRMVK
ncbi:MAG: hisZ [Oscillospiraceae bacterium]|jgi:ATP phosphoribosyltransferase regulatory subunit|nr:hisZ [Oscillospiraceae bacterium]